ncbi:MAG: hypothetical protein ACLRX4_01105 [Oscillospiraceae bacterium]
MSEKGKEAGIAVTAEELARINRFAKKELRAEEVYTFAVKLCDNEVDRDFERFDRAALEKLSELFVGRTGIFDHSWSAGGQTARIYRAEVIEEETRTTAGDKYCWCKGWAYMLRTEKNAELIAEIEGGIKKEVSVGCSAAKRSCSICGKDAGLCEHERGKYYGGKLCYAVLSDITDAYEWSFVAVPAQRAAGVVKRFGQSEGSLKAMVRACGSRAQMRELEELEKLSALGKSYLGALRREVRRLMLVADETLDGAVAESVTEKLGERELLELKKAFGARAAKSSVRMCRSVIRVRSARRTSATSACEQRNQKSGALFGINNEEKRRK